MDKPTTLQQVRLAALRAQADTASRLGQLAEAVAMDLDGKQDKPIAVSITIATTGWSSDDTARYPKYYDIAVAGVTERDFASVDLSPASAGTAIGCGLCPACEMLEGKIRIRAISVPTVSMTATCWIEKGD